MVEPHRQVLAYIRFRRVLEETADVDMDMLEESLHCQMAMLSFCHGVAYQLGLATLVDIVHLLELIRIALRCTDAWMVHHHVFVALGGRKMPSRCL